MVDRWLTNPTIRFRKRHAWVPDAEGVIVFSRRFLMLLWLARLEDQILASDGHSRRFRRSEAKSFPEELAAS